TGASTTGLGYLICSSWQLFIPEKLYVGLLVIGIIGAGLTSLLSRSEKLLLPWRRDSCSACSHPSHPKEPLMRRRTLLSLASAAALGGALAACGPAVTGEDPSGGSGDSAGTGGTVRVGHVPSSLFAPLYVADAKGFFEEAGITVELTPLKSGQDGIPMLSNDQLDVMIAGFSAGMFNALD